jgi:hypothetical protein
VLGSESEFEAVLGLVGEPGSRFSGDVGVCRRGTERSSRLNFAVT